MRTKWKQTLLGAFCGAWVMITGSCASSTVSIRNEHDEPVIIQNDSEVIDLNPRVSRFVAVDFNPQDNPATKGEFKHENGVSTFLRADADSVKLIRIWKKSGGDPFVEQYCSNNGPCNVENWQSNAMRLTLSNGAVVWFTWVATGHGELKMVSAKHKFMEAPKLGAKRPHRVRTEIVDTNGPMVDKVEFRRGTITETFTRGDKEDIRVMLCLSTQTEKCTHDPNKP